MRVGSAAKVLDVHPDTLRRLERHGRFQFQRDWRGHRRIRAEDLARLKAILYPNLSEAKECEERR